MTIIVRVFLRMFILKDNKMNVETHFCTWD